MAYEVKLTIAVKMFKGTTHRQMIRTLMHALEVNTDIRDVQFIDYEGDTEPDPITICDELNDLMRKDMEKNPYIPKSTQSDQV